MADRAEGERVLVLAPLGRDAEVLCRLLAEDGLAPQPCRDAADLAGRVREEAGAVLLTEEALAAGAAEALAQALREQLPWSDLPVLLLDGGSRAEAVRSLGNVTVLPRPARALAVVTAVRSALRARRRQYEVRDLLTQLREARDVLERRVDERTAELRRSQERALQAERLAAIGQTVTALTHEGRNALQRAHAFLQRLTWRVQGQTEALDLAAQAGLALDDLQRLFDDVRGYAAPVQLAIQPCDLGAVWRQAWEQATAAHPARDARPGEEAAGVNLACRADPFRLGQVFRILFDNALEACPDPVCVTVSVRETDFGGRPALRVSVRDNGPGLSPEQRQRLFEPFYTTKVAGTGLGLAIAQRILEAHGGQVAAGEGGPGAEFVVTLPRQRS